MRVLYASERPPYPFFLGGAARSAHHLLHALAKNLRTECLAVGSKDFSRSRWHLPDSADYRLLGIESVTVDDWFVTVDGSYQVLLFDNFWKTLGRTIKSFAPDIVWTQLEGAVDIVHLAHRNGTPAVVYLRDVLSSPEWLRSLAATDCGLVCNSRFVAQRLLELTGRNSCVIYPSLGSSLGVEGDRQGFITMINPYPAKGINTFLEIARRLPAEKFLVVESWPLAPSALQKLQKELEGLPQVRFIRRTPDIREIYGQTKLLLVPSVSDEAFGRVVLEAQSCGIPVIASLQGGLQEAVGEGGLCVRDFLDPDAWLEHVRPLLNDPAWYLEMAGRSRRHSLRDAFAAETAACHFLDFCRNHCVADSSLARKALSLRERILRFLCS